jgi:Fe-S cluster assembly protein SufD
MATDTPFTRLHIQTARDVAATPWQQRALQALEEAGFPDRRVEEFRFFDAASVLNQSWTLDGATSPAESRRRVDALELPAAAAVIVIVDGQMLPELSDVSRLPELQVSQDDASVDWVALAARSRTPFGAWAQACQSGRVQITLPADTRVEEPVIVVFLQSALSPMEHGSAVTHVRLGRNSQLSVLEVHASVGLEIALNTSCVFYDVGDGAVLERGVLHSFGSSVVGITESTIELGRDSRILQVAASVSHADVRETTAVHLRAAGAHAALNALLAAGAKDNVDHHTLIDHLVADCTSEQLYKTMLSGNGHGVFNGRIIVHPRAQRTAANQLSRALMLSAGARLDAKPQLEIFADDVRCTHGATVGQLDEQELFYLSSRAIPPALGRAMLVRGFAREITDCKSNLPMRQWMEQQVDRCVHRLAAQQD